MTPTRVVRSLELDLSPQSIDQIPASSLTPELFIERYRKSGTPVMINGLLAAEPVWNLDYLRHHLGDRGTNGAFTWGACWLSHIFCGTC